MLIYIVSPCLLCHPWNTDWFIIMLVSCWGEWIPYSAFSPKSAVQWENSEGRPQQDDEDVKEQILIHGQLYSRIWYHLESLKSIILRGCFQLALWHPSLISCPLDIQELQLVKISDSLYLLGNSSLQNNTSHCFQGERAFAVFLDRWEKRARAIVYSSIDLIFWFLKLERNCIHSE